MAKVLTAIRTLRLGKDRVIPFAKKSQAVKMGKHLARKMGRDVIIYRQSNVYLVVHKAKRKLKRKK